MGANRLVLVANGAGAALAGEACEVAWAKAKAAALISTGFCGALDPALGPGEVFVASTVEAPASGLRFEARAPECGAPHASGRLISLDHVVGSAQERRSLRALGASAVEMEAAAVGQRARAWGASFYCIRGVTDLAEEEFRLDFNAARDRDGRLSDARVCWAAARRPLVLAPEVFRLFRRSRLAARALGDFLAECRF
jgi:adenosylhomocysteine nucleosidase